MMKWMKVFGVLKITLVCLYTWWRAAGMVQCNLSWKSTPLARKYGKQLQRPPVLNNEIFLTEVEVWHSLPEIFVPSRQVVSHGFYCILQTETKEMIWPIKDRLFLYKR